MHPQVTVLQTTHIKFSSSPGSYCSGKVTIVGRHPKNANKQIAYFMVYKIALSASMLATHRYHRNILALVFSLVW